MREPARAHEQPVAFGVWRPVAGPAAPNARGGRESVWSLAPRSGACGAKRTWVGKAFGVWRPVVGRAAPNAALLTRSISTLLWLSRGCFR